MLVRVVWRDGRATPADIMWVRSVSQLVAAAPVHLAMKHLRSWEDLVLGHYSEDDARRVEREARDRGHDAELLGRYSASYVASALGCRPLGDEELRVVFLPSFHCEGVVTARRTVDRWDVELRVGRESIWYTRFSPVPPEDWPEVARTPGVSVVVGTEPRAALRGLEQRLVSSARDVRPRDHVGVDGMNVEVSSRLADAAFDERVWSPSPGCRVRAAADLALALIGDLASDWSNRIEHYLQ